MTAPADHEKASCLGGENQMVRKSIRRCPTFSRRNELRPLCLSPVLFIFLYFCSYGEWTFGQAFGKVA